MVGDSPALWLVHVFLQGLPALEGVNSSWVQVIFEDVDEHRAENGALQNPISDRSDVTAFTTTLCAEHMSQLLTHSMTCLSSCVLGIWSIKDTLRDNMESFTEIQKEYIS